MLRSYRWECSKNVDPKLARFMGEMVVNNGTSDDLVPVFRHTIGSLVGVKIIQNFNELAKTRQDQGPMAFYTCR